MKRSKLTQYIVILAITAAPGVAAAGAGHVAGEMKRGDGEQQARHAHDGKGIDANRDGQVSADELRAFLSKTLGTSTPQ